MRGTMCTLWAVIAAGGLAASAWSAETAPVAAHPLAFINTAFENASPLFWDVDDDGIVDVFLLYDHERSAPNRAAGHWHFRVEAAAGATVTLVLNNL
jgi:hypothetical protein